MIQLFGFPVFKKSLSDKEYILTSEKKRDDSLKGKQFSKQPKSIAKKIKKFRK